MVFHFQSILYHGRHWTCQIEVREKFKTSGQMNIECNHETPSTPNVSNVDIASYYREMYDL